ATNGQLIISNADGTSPVRIVNDSENNVISSISWQRASATLPKTYVVSGRLLGGSGSTVIELGGARTGSITSDFDGNYAIGNLPEGSNLTLKPISNFFRFDPPSRAFNNLTADQPAADFNAIRITTTIRGRITDFSGAPIGGVTVSA